MSDYIGVSMKIKKHVRDSIAMQAKQEGRSMIKQIEIILSKESMRIDKKAFQIEEQNKGNEL